MLQKKQALSLQTFKENLTTTQLKGGLVIIDGKPREINLKPKTIQEASRGVQLKTLERNGEIEAIGILSAVISKFLQFVKHNANAKTILSWSEALLEDFWYMKLEEVIYALTEVRKGHIRQEWGEFTYRHLSEALLAFDKTKMDSINDNVESARQGYRPPEEDNHTAAIQSIGAAFGAIKDRLKDNREKMLKAKDNI